MKKKKVLSENATCETILAQQAHTLAPFHVHQPELKPERCQLASIPYWQEDIGLSSCTNLTGLPASVGICKQTSTIQIAITTRFVHEGKEAKEGKTGDRPNFASFMCHKRLKIRQCIERDISSPRFARRTRPPSSCSSGLSAKLGIP